MKSITKRSQNEMAEINTNLLVITINVYHSFKISKIMFLIMKVPSRSLCVAWEQATQMATQEQGWLPPAPWSVTRAVSSGAAITSRCLACGSRKPVSEVFILMADDLASVSLLQHLLACLFPRLNLY